MRNYIVVLAFICGALQAGTLEQKDVVVDATLTHEFKKPLPEFIVFNAQHECVMHTKGFGTDEVFFKELDTVMSGGTVIPVAHKNIDEKIEAALRKSIMENNAIPDNMKEQVIANSLKEMTTPFPACGRPLSEVLETLLDDNGNKLEAAMLPKNKTIVVEYFADWCVPCRAQEKALKLYAKQNEGDFYLLKVERDATKREGK